MSPDNTTTWTGIPVWSTPTPSNMPQAPAASVTKTVNQDSKHTTSDTTNKFNLGDLFWFWHHEDGATDNQNISQNLNFHKDDFVNVTPVQSVPVQSVPVQPAPVQPVPVQSVPVQSASVQPASVQPASVQPAPVQSAPVQSASVQSASVQPVPVQPVPVIVKKWSKISPVNFAIGCSVFGLLVIWAIAMVLYFAIQNPDQFKWIISIEGIKIGLKLFSWLFFWLIFFAWFGLGIFNLYKLITTKIGSKVWYIIGIVMSLILLTGSARWGIASFKKINEIIGTTWANSSLIIPMIPFKDKMRPISDWFPIIAPTQISYLMNPDLFKKFVATNFSNKRINTLQLSCWNEEKQVLNYDPSQNMFVWVCLYTKKWSYPISMLINSTDPATNTNKDETIDLWPLFIISEITLTPSQWTLTLNDTKNELIIGKAPVKLGIDSSRIFEDLWLSQYNIERDLDNDGTFDKKWDTNFSYQFRTPQLQTVAYTLPDVQGYSDLVYLLSFRVQQNDVPICTLTTTPGTKPTQYTITATFDDNETAITSYLYKAKDITNNKVLTLPIVGKSSFDYEFAKKWAYAIMLEYATEDGKLWYCETDTIQAGTSSFTTRYSINFRWPNDSKWQSVTQSGAVSLIDNTLSVWTLPMRLQLLISDITPQTKQTTVSVELDGKTILSPDNSSYELTLQNTSHEKISIIISDPSLAISSTIEIPIKVIQQDVLGQMKVFPDSVGVSPFEVTLDATTTTLTDPEDEIIYFSRDFWDGSKNPNTSQGRVTHTYVYNEKDQSGTYTPSVTITTKKGKKMTIKLRNPLLVKKPALQSKIMIDSHPAQIAKIWDQVTFTVQSDGSPTHVARDFGNGNPIECDDRSCMTIPTLFERAGEYTIKATITYSDLSKSISSTKLIVEQ